MSALVLQPKFVFTLVPASPLIKQLAYDNMVRDLEYHTASRGAMIVAAVGDH
ncbi:MAG: hypothetical protein P9L99_09040 [Candidatus Lernaella stagnicola]|nr:hypothetical protein [Candidatus Lernaella stagnicola]